MVRNRAVAVTALIAGLPEHDWQTISSVALEGFSLPGRIEVVSERPRIVFDGAHNEQAIRAVLEAINGQIVCVYSCATGHRPLVDVLSEKCRRVYTAAMNHPRALSASDWDTTHPSVLQALRAALAELQQGETLLVTGSFFLLAEAKDALRNLTSERL